MGRHPIRVVVRRPTHDTARIHTNLGDVDCCDLPAVFGALAAHAGLDPVPMRMAVRHKPPKKPDPRYPALTKLIAAARRDWTRWGDQLVKAVVDAHKRGKLLPMNPSNEALLHDLFRDHHIKLSARFAGHTHDLPRLERLIRRGLVEPSVRDRSYIDIAYRLGAGLDMLSAHRVVGADDQSLTEAVREAVKIPLSEMERGALAYTKRRGAIYMRRPAETATSEVSRALNDVELAKLRTATAKGVDQRMGHRDLARTLKDAVQGHPTLANNMDRVARTELAFAHSHGAYVKLKKQASEAGVDDPWVYKFASPGACNDCKRIWGLPGNPKRYKLSHIEEREAAGGNFNRPRAQWGPVIGPVHPHCTEGPLQYHHPALVQSITEAADEIMAFYGS